MTLGNEVGTSPEAIRHHYDIGNEFYRLWLDQSLTYSCAFWEPNDTLEVAQMRKIDYIADLAHADGARRILDVGCGWGAAMQRLLDSHGVTQAVGLTLSEAQAHWIRSRTDPRIDVRVESWSVHSPNTPYDSIISIGAFEHFARPRLSRAEKVSAYRTFFTHCHSMLRPGGYLGLQTIGIGDVPFTRQLRKDLIFIMREIFPESSLPRLSEIVEASEQLFEVTTVRNDRTHYMYTCREWLQRLQAHHSEAVACVGQDQVSSYERYLDAAANLFQRGQIVLLRIGLQRVI